MCWPCSRTIPAPNRRRRRSPQRPTAPGRFPTAAEEAILAQEAAIFLPSEAERAILTAESRAATATDAENRILTREAETRQAGSPQAETPMTAMDPTTAPPGQWVAFGVAPDTAVTAQTIRDVKEQAADTRALEATAALNAAGPAKRPQPRPTPSGAAAADGGWFTDAMLTALEALSEERVAGRNRRRFALGHVRRSALARRKSRCRPVHGSHRIEPRSRNRRSFPC